MESACEVHFLDVGQGSSAVVFFRNPEENRLEAIVIDGGPPTPALPAPVPFLVLTDFADYVRAVFVTHNHEDHIGGLIPVVKTWSVDGKFGRLYAGYDNSEGVKKLAGAIRDLKRKRRFQDEQIGWLHEGDVHLFPAEGENIRVEVLAPTASEALLMRNPNEASSVLRLSYGAKNILFCGDSTRAIWDRIVQKPGGGLLECEAVAVPHHGGHMGGVSSPDGRWFFASAVKPKVAIFSFGASNEYNHPRPDVVRAARTHGLCRTILCTEVHPDRNAPPYPGDKDGMFQPTPYSLSYQDRSCHENSTRRRHYACAGSITVGLDRFGARWGHSGDPDPICAFRTIEQFQSRVESAFRRTGRDFPPCHGGICR
jgi:beta-lactamase superfamily II metal-dependent hydrolase